MDGRFQTDRQTDRALSLDNLNCLKGILAVGILIHHLYQWSGILRGTLIGYGLQAIGYWIVSTFFFLSGYGLTKSYQRNGKDYLKRFPAQRVMPFFLIIVFLTIIYALNNYIIGNSLGVREVFTSLLFGRTIIGNGWYLQVQLLLYLLFWIAFRFLHKCYPALFITLATLAYMVFCYMSEMSSTWFVTSILFPFGILLAFFEPGSHLMIKSKWMFFAALSLLLCLSTYLIQSIVDVRATKTVLLSLSSIGFTAFLVCLLYKVPIQCRITKTLGRISLEIYVLQGIFLSLFKSAVIEINKPFYYILFVTICTMLSAIIIHPLFEKFYALGRKIAILIR